MLKGSQYMTSKSQPTLEKGKSLVFNYKGKPYEATITKVKRTYVLAKLKNDKVINLSMKLITHVNSQPFDFFKSPFRENMRTWQPNPTLMKLFEQLNKKYFEGQLKPIKISSSANMRLTGGKFGIRQHQSNYIRLAQNLPQRVQTRVLLHEMVHYYIYSILKKPHERHGQLFNEITNRLGIGQARLEIGTRIELYHLTWRQWLQGTVIKRFPYRIKVKVQLKDSNRFTELSVSPDLVFKLN